MFTALETARIVALEPLERTTSPARFQYLLDAQADGAYGPIFLGPWTYSLGTTKLTCKSNNVAVFGCGRTSVLGWSGSPGGIQVNDGTGVETLSTVWRDFVLDGGSATTGADYGFILGDGSASSFKTGSGLFSNLLVKRFKTAGVQLQFTALARFTKCRFASNRDGVWASSVYTNGVTGVTFDGCEAAANVKRGWFFEQANSILLTNLCEAEDNGEEGILWMHPGGGTVSFRNGVIRNAYVEDNGVSGAFADIRFDNASTQSMQNMKVADTIISGANADGNIWLGKGTFTLEDNEFLNVSTSCILTGNSSVCFAHSRDVRDPATLWTPGSATGTTHERRGGNGTLVQLYNNAGTLRGYGYRTTTATTVTHVATDRVILASANSGAVTVNLIDASLTTLRDGYKLTVVKTDASANAVTLDGSGAQTINGAATLALAAQYDRTTIVKSGSSWIRVD